MFIKNEQMVGPLFILCCLALAPVTFPLFVLATGGLVLCNLFPMRGLYIVFAILGLFIVWDFAFALESFPFWNLGLYLSYGLGFLVTALGREEALQASESLFSQWEARGQSLLHLEEEMKEMQAQNSAIQVSQQDKIEMLQKQMEESFAEHSSVLVLNEVLRQTAARHLADAEIAKESLTAFQTRYGLMMEHQEALEKELEELKDSSHLASEKGRLTSALHAAELEKEQTHLINETLARLHAQEHLKATSAMELLEEQKDLARQAEEKALRLEEILGQAEEKEARALSQIENQKAALAALQQELASIQAESVLRPSVEAVDLSQYVHRETLQSLEERVKNLAQVEALYLQLKAQFKEKNQVLHEVRKELFHAQTSLETLKMEKEAEEHLVSHTAFPEIVRELSLLEGECARLQEENDELHRLVTALQVLPPTIAPKKEKTSRHHFLQASLFEV